MPNTQRSTPETQTSTTTCSRCLRRQGDKVASDDNKYKYLCTLCLPHAKNERIGIICTHEVPKGSDSCTNCFAHQTVITKDRNT